MPDIDWNVLSPHRPLGFGDKLYVPRPGAAGALGGGEKLAALVRAGRRPVAVAGPAGAGKSTELSVAAGTLQKDFVACLIPLDRLLDAHRLTWDEALRHIAGHLAAMALSVLRIKLSPELKAVLVASEVLNPKFAPNATAEDLGTDTGAEVLLRLVREVRKIGRRGTTVLLVDGLEKCTPETSRDVVKSLLAMREEVGLVLVVPPGMVMGPSSYDVVSLVRVVPVRAVPVLKEPGAGWQPAREFLRAMVQKRLGMEAVSTGFSNLLGLAAERSGGLPRLFLELVQDAGGYASMAGRELPTLPDLDEATRDHADTLACLLRDGDAAALKAADGTTGVEVPLERRLRFLEQGLLFEYELNGEVRVHPAPLLRLGAE